MQRIERGGDTNSASPMWWRASFCQTTARNPLQRIHHHRLEAPVKQMPAPPVSAVKPYAVTPIEPLTRPAQVGLAQLDQEMIVIVHQHEGVQTDLETANQLGQQLAEVLPVPVVSEDRPPLIAPRSHDTSLLLAQFAMALPWPRSCITWQPKVNCRLFRLFRCDPIIQSDVTQ